MKNKHFSVMPIGGVEEIGSNMTLIKTPTEDILIDCGILFPYEECFDINYLIPDFSAVDPERTKSIVITHGHEDHIGALGHLLQEFPHLTVHTTPFTLKLIEKKLQEWDLKFNYSLYTPGEDLIFDSVTITPVHVNHSIPETNGMIIRTKDLSWGALYISDFKVDLFSSFEAPIDFKLIQEKLNPCKKTIFFLDSTNITNDGKTVSEDELNHDLKDLVEGSEDRLFVTLFASNVHRLEQICKMGKAAGRRIVVMGRSLKNYLEAASESGHSSLASEDVLLPENVKGESGRLLILLSGCQGDFLSALRRFSYGEDSNFKPTPADKVVFSSKVIPGNEKKVARIYNKLTEHGAHIVTAYDSLIHASGHPGKEDLHLLLKSFSPDYYVPIHGESYMLLKHYDFIKEHYPKISPLIIYNYQEIILGDNDVKVEKHVHKDPRLIHGKRLEIERTQISQRRKLATLGAAFVSYVPAKNELNVTTLGLPLSADGLKDKLLKKLEHSIKKDLHSREPEYVKEQLRIQTRQFYNNFLGYKPVTEVHLIK